MYHVSRRWDLYETITLNVGICAAYNCGFMYLADAVCARVFLNRNKHGGVCADTGEGNMIIIKV